MLHLKDVLFVVFQFFVLSKADITLISTSTQITPMAQAVQHFIEVYFLNSTTTLALMMETTNHWSMHHFDELLLEIVKPLNSLTLTLATGGAGDIKSFAYFNILMVDSYAAFRKIDPGPRSQNQDFSEFYVIVLHTSSQNIATEMQQIFDYCWRYYIVNVSILFEGAPNQIQLYTYYPFSPVHCHRAVIELLNGNKTVQELRADELFPQKMVNFYNCTLMGALWNVPPYLVLPQPLKGVLNFDGFEGLILETLAQIMNFSIDYIIPPNNEQRGLVLHNGSLTGAIKMLQQRKADLSLGSFRCSHERSTTLSPTKPFYQTWQVFTVLAVSEPWSTFEILAYPFHYHVWTALLVVLISLALSAVMLQFIKPRILHFIYGFPHYSLVLLSLAATLLSQQSRPPQRHFARYILILWLLLTLILRSAYQGLLYGFLSTRKTLKPPDTVRELIERGYKVIVTPPTFDSYINIPVLRDKLLEMVIMDISDAGGFPILEREIGQHLATGTPRDFLLHYVNTNSKYGVFHVVKEVVYTQQLCIYFTKHSYLAEPFENVLFKLRSFGLVNLWASNHFDDTFLEVKSTNDVKQPLNLNQLNGIFQIQNCAWVVAALVLVGEILWNRRIRR